MPQPRNIGARSVVSLPEFEKQYAAFTNNFFDGFDFSNVIVIGGSVVGSLLPIPDNYEKLYRFGTKKFIANYDSDDEFFYDENAPPAENQEVEGDPIPEHSFGIYSSVIA